jgi:hypothetical protein
MGVSLGHAFEAGLPTARESLGRLRAMSYVELKSLPPHGTVELADLGRRVTLTTYRDVLGSEVQVVVQLVAHGRLGFSKIWARGIRAPASGGYRDLGENELYEYT